MVSLEQIRSSNSGIAKLPPGLIAVFAGATSGIGETSLKQFAKNAVKPRIYFVGRSKESGERVRADLQKLNAEGEYIYISADVSLIRGVDDVCRQILEKESSINLLFITTGTMVTGKDTEEGLNYPCAVTYYARIRLIVNLLPLVRKATDLRRVVSVFAGAKEGNVDTTDFQARKVPVLAQRGHIATMMTLSLEAVAKDAPEVSFIHDFPGAVKTNLGKDVKSLAWTVMKGVFKVIGPFITISFDEAGERQAFFATSARFPEGKILDGNSASGVPLANGLTVATGADGNPGSGVYTIGIDGESASEKNMRTLASQRKDGVLEKTWAHNEEEFVRITGTNSL